ncbi:MAG: NnrU family protein [Azospirillaceae bacterium]|nr:NnrU family protein [Azospirillaceae bacterium]
MIGTMTGLALAAMFFVGSHIVLAHGAVRPWLVSRIGDMPYRGLFSTVALLGLVWLGWAYREAPLLVLWPPEPWQWFGPLVVMPVALFLLVGGVSTPNPSAVGQEGPVGPNQVRGVLRVTRNPVMWAIGLWALAHLVPNSDVASFILFGSLAALALGGSLLLDRKMALRHGDAWLSVVTVSSNLPFRAIADGRQHFGRVLAEMGPLRLAIVVVAYAALLHGHIWLIGVSALPPL